MKLIVPFFTLAILCGCTSDAAKSAGGKNLDMSGYVMFGGLETADAVTSTPTGKLIIGKVTYKSRKVGIPGTWKVPNSGSFRATKTVSLFGAEDFVVEYDWTAGSDADAEKAEKKCQELMKEMKAKAEAKKAETAKTETKEAEKTTEKTDTK